MDSDKESAYKCAYRLIINGRLTEEEFVRFLERETSRAMQEGYETANYYNQLFSKNKMTLSEFIKNKPSELRLGQHCMNTYCKPVDGVWSDGITKLFYLQNDLLADWEIRMLLSYWQLDENSMPEMD